MGLLRAIRPQSQCGIKDKFHLKRAADTAFLKARNERCATAAGLISGSFVYLDSPKLGTTTALVDAGVDAARLFPVNGSDRGDFCKKAVRLGVRPTVSMFDASPPCLDELGVGNIQLCYNDGTHGDPDRVWADMLPWLQRLGARAYVSFTFANRSHNALPLTAKFGLITMLAQRGFEPPGGWQRLKTAFTFDGRIFNVHMVRGVAPRLCKGLAQNNGYSFEARSDKSAASDNEDLGAVVQNFLKQCPQAPYPMNAKTPHGAKWEELRRRICRSGLKGERQAFAGLKATAWVVEDYEHWKMNAKERLPWHLALRFPQRLQKSEAKHWSRVGNWVMASLSELQGPTVLVVLDAAGKTARYRQWVEAMLSEDVLRRTLCVGDPDVTPGIKATVTRGTCRVARVREGLCDFLSSSTGEALLHRFKDRFSLVFLPFLTPTTYEGLEEAIGKALDLADEGAMVVLSLRGPSPHATVAWMIQLISWLAQSHGCGLASCCEMHDNGQDLLDYSRILTVVLRRGSGKS